MWKSYPYWLNGNTLNIMRLTNIWVPHSGVEQWKGIRVFTLTAIESFATGAYCSIVNNFSYFLISLRYGPIINGPRIPHLNWISVNWKILPLVFICKNENPFIYFIFFCVTIKRYTQNHLFVCEYLNWRIQTGHKSCLLIVKVKKNCVWFITRYVHPLTDHLFSFNDGDKVSWCLHVKSF